MTLRRQGLTGVSNRQNKLDIIGVNWAFPFVYFSKMADGNEDVIFCETVKALIKDDFEKAKEFEDSGNIVEQLMHLCNAVRAIDVAILTCMLDSNVCSELQRQKNEKMAVIKDLKTKLKGCLNSQQVPQSPKSDETNWNFDILKPTNNIEDIIGQVKIKTLLQLGFEGGKKFPNYSSQFAAEIIPKSYLLYGPPGMLSGRKGKET